jgi:uncharacterized BrkB/YihY/UPF0761 family membrane protein
MPSVVESTDPPQSVPQHANGSRFALAMACWLLSSLGVLLSLMVAVSGLVRLFQQPLAVSLHDRQVWMSFAIGYAWSALFVMSSSWVDNRRVAWHWPVMGGMVSGLCAAIFAPFILLCFPCLYLAGYLCFFHLSGLKGSVLPRP